MGYRPWIAALAGGFLAALGHAPFSLWYLAVPGFVAFVWAVTEASTKRQGFALAWLAATATSASRCIGSSNRFWSMQPPMAGWHRAL